VTDALTTLAVRLALCLALSAFARWLFGATGLILGLLLLGVALARPLLDLASAVRHEMRRANWRDVHGHHFSFRGHSVRVVEDADHQRWVRLSDIRAIAGFTASDASLKLTYPKGWQLYGRAPVPYLSDEALLEHLAKERAPTAVKLRLWVEREIVFPARRQRERHGIRIDTLDFRTSD
jgi:hypothetical protein